MLKTLRSALAALVVCGLLLAPAALPAQAARQPLRVLNMVQLGDSYSSGNGAGQYESGSGLAFRSMRNWGRNVASTLNKRGIITTYKNLAHSGNVSDDVLKTQIPQIPAETDLVLMTIGGNDVGFAEIVFKCFTLGLRSAKGCQGAVEKANSLLPHVERQTEEIFRRLEQRLRPGAKVVLSSYPLLSTTRSYVLEQCVELGFFRCKKTLNYAAADEVRALGQKATQVQKRLVDRWNARHKMRVIFVDSLPQAFAGHEPDPSVTEKNPYRWINEFFETEGVAAPDGRVSSKFSAWVGNWYHPNVTGYERFGAEVAKYLPDSQLPFHPVRQKRRTRVVVAVDRSTVSSGQARHALRAVRSVASVADDGQAVPMAMISMRSMLEDVLEAPAELAVGFTQDEEAWAEASEKVAAEAPVAVEEGVANNEAGVADLDSAMSADAVAQSLGDEAEDVLQSSELNDAQSPAVDAVQSVNSISDSTAVNPGQAVAVEPATQLSTIAESLAESAEGQTTTLLVVSNNDDESVRQATQELADALGSNAQAEVARFADDSDAVAQGEVTEVNDAVVHNANVQGDESTELAEAMDAEGVEMRPWVQGPVAALVGEETVIDAGASYSTAGSIVRYEWDFDDNGQIDEVTSDAQVTHTFDAPYSGSVRVRVTDALGNSAEAQAQAFVVTEVPIAESPVQTPSEDAEGVRELLDGQASAVRAALDQPYGVLAFEDTAQSVEGIKVEVQQEELEAIPDIPGDETVKQLIEDSKSGNPQSAGEKWAMVGKAAQESGHKKTQTDRSGQKLAKTGADSMHVASVFVLLGIVGTGLLVGRRAAS